MNCYRWNFLVSLFLGADLVCKYTYIIIRGQKLNDLFAIDRFHSVRLNFILIERAIRTDEIETMRHTNVTILSSSFLAITFEVRTCRLFMFTEIT